MRIIEISAADTHDLRRRVLRSGDPTVSVEWPEDARTGTVHLGAVEPSGRIVAISTWIETDDGVQLRGMATDPSASGSGVGSTLLEAGIDRFRSGGAPRVWANARVTALGFYERAGFTVSGPVFVTAATGLPHRLISLELH